MKRRVVGVKLGVGVGVVAVGVMVDAFRAARRGNGGSNDAREEAKASGRRAASARLAIRALSFRSEAFVGTCVRSLHVTASIPFAHDGRQFLPSFSFGIMDAATSPSTSPVVFNHPPPPVLIGGLIALL